MKSVFKYIWRMLGRYTSPVFVLLLLLATVMWYISKLSYEYTTQIPVDITVDENRFRVYCVVEGTGYKLFAHRYIFNDEIKLTLDDIECTPSVKEKDFFTINQLSLQNAISTRKDDLRIVSVGDIPEITLITEDR